jgi:hypothetical protein
MLSELSMSSEEQNRLEDTVVSSNLKNRKSYDKQAMLFRILKEIIHSTKLFIHCVEEQSTIRNLIILANMEAKLLNHDFADR